MDRLTKGAKVAVKHWDAKKKAYAPVSELEHRGKVVEAADDGLSGYVYFSDDEGQDRVFFHASELQIVK